MARQITFTLSEDDYAEAARSQYWHRVRSPKQWAGALAALVIMCGLLAFLESYDAESFFYNLAPYALLIAVGATLMAGFSYFWVARYARRLFRQQMTNPESRVSWDVEGLQIESALGALTAKWGDFYSWRSSGAFYMIHINQVLYYLIPRRALSPDQAADLENTLITAGVKRR